MSEQGVPSEVLVGDDHMQVRAGLVKLLGGGNEALVWARVEFRTRHVAFAHENAGRQWWEVTQAQVGAEVGLSTEAAKGALRRLVERGFLLAEQHSLPMQTTSYSPVILQSVESPIGAVPIGREPHSNRSNAPLQSVDSPIPPSIQEKEEVEEHSGATDGVSELFEMAWKHWPRKDAKKTARQKFDRLNPTQHVHVALAIKEHGDAHAKFTPTQFVPHLATWLNQERWNDPLPVARGNGGVSPTDRALATLALAGDQRQGISA